MPALYSEHTCDPINRQLKNRLTLLIVLEVILLGVFVWAMISRIQWLAITAALLAGCFGIFFIDLFCMPLFRYRRMVRNAMSGRQREKEMEFARLEPDVSVVDGVPCRSLIFLGDPDKHGSREMRLYWDQQIPMEEMVPGDVYAVVYSGMMITALDPAAPSSRP